MPDSIAAVAVSPPPGSHAPRPWRIVCWPFGRANPYQRLLYEALAKHQISMSAPTTIDDAWLVEHAHEFDCLHLHWPEELWRVRGTSVWGRLRGVIGLWRFLRRTRKLGKRVIWTVHNLAAHEGVDWVDRLGYAVLRRQADLLICHDESTAQILRGQVTGATLVEVMPHGNYAGVYPPPAPRAATMAELGLDPDKLTFACLGQIRRYKGHDVVLDALRHSELPCQVIIAGTIHRSHDDQALEQQLRELPQVRLLPRFVSDQEFSNLAAAADAVLLPYHRVTGSGALLAALTLGRPVIASDLPFFRDLLQLAPAAGELFEPGNASSLLAAIGRFREIPAEQRGAAARQIADHFAWDEVVKPVLKVIDSWRH